jgi:hypothetical protein
MTAGAPKKAEKKVGNTNAFSIARFPPSRFAAIFVLNTADGWLVLAPRGHGWLHATRAAARADARWLGHNLGLPIREVP